MWKESSNASFLHQPFHRSNHRCKRHTCHDFKSSHHKRFAIVEAIGAGEGLEDKVTRRGGVVTRIEWGSAACT